MNRINGNLAYQEEPETEIIGGKVIMMASPSLNHLFVSGNIYAIFHDYLRGKTCVPIHDGGTVFLEDGEEYKPDMMIVCDPNKITRKGIHGAPDLVVEILSPSTMRRDKGRKMKAYERNGVKEYWIVDPVQRFVEQYTLEGGRFELRDVYIQYTPETLEELTDEEKAAIVTEFHCSLFDDLLIRVEDIFYRVTDK